FDRTWSMRTYLTVTLQSLKELIYTGPLKHPRPESEAVEHVDDDHRISARSSSPAIRRVVAARSLTLNHHHHTALLAPPAAHSPSPFFSTIHHIKNARKTRSHAQSRVDRAQIHSRAATQDDANEEKEKGGGGGGGAGAKRGRNARRRKMRPSPSYPPSAIV
ncbi:hypothetical protein K525DRAFT_246596, partial [Schizophyllum commune Loenen D]